MFIVDTRIKIAAGDYSNQSLDYAVNNTNGAIYKALDRKLEVNEAVMFEGQPTGSKLNLADIIIEQCPTSYWYDGTNLNAVKSHAAKQYCMDGEFVFVYKSDDPKFTEHTPVNLQPGSIHLPHGEDVSQVKLTRAATGASAYSVLLLCVRDDNPLYLEDRTGEDFYNRVGHNDIPLLINKDSTSLSEWNSFNHTAITRTDSESVLIDFTAFNNVYPGKEVIFRLQVDHCTTPGLLYNGDTWISESVRRRTCYSGNTERNKNYADGGALPGIVVSEHTGKQYTIGRRAAALVDYESSSFGFEDNQDYNYSDFFGTQSDPEFEIITIDRDKFGATGDRSLAQGKNVLAQGGQSFAQGSFTHAVAEDSVVLGRWNEANPENIFEVGIGLKKDPKNGFSLSVEGVGKLPKQEDQIEAPDDIVVKGNLDTRIGTSVSSPATIGAVPTYDTNGNIVEQKGPHAVSGEEYPYLQVNGDGSISAPCCKASDINFPDDLITLQYLNNTMQSITNPPRLDIDPALPPSVTVSGLTDATWNGSYTLQGSYYRKGAEDKYIGNGHAQNVWVIASHPSTPYYNSVNYVTAMHPHNQEWVPMTPGLGNAIVVADNAAPSSKAIETNGDISTSSVVQAEGGFVSQNRLGMGWSNQRERAEIQFSPLDAGDRFAVMSHGEEKFLINTNGVISAPTANNDDIAASPKALVTKEYADANYSGGGGGSMLTYGFSRISWAGNTNFGPNGASDCNGDCAHLIFRTGTITQLSYFFEGHNTNGAIKILRNGNVVYTSPDVASGSNHNGLISNLNIPVSQGQKLSVVVVGGGQRGQITIVVEG